ncbi:hypothetical protein KSP39_PZI014494 [Platanthera zijinensis]|uniref:Uncharacterized protein n=1 Tax=Platanthera zijinensis TaxID=2320716 RepID=A0AAP0G2P0_9ASPA
MRHHSILASYIPRSPLTMAQLSGTTLFVVLLILLQSPERFEAMVFDLNCNHKLIRMICLNHVSCESLCAEWKNCPVGCSCSGECSAWNECFCQDCPYEQPPGGHGVCDSSAFGHGGHGGSKGYRGHGGRKGHGGHGGSNGYGGHGGSIGYGGHGGSNGYGGHGGSNGYGGH